MTFHNPVLHTIGDDADSEKMLNFWTSGSDPAQWVVDDMVLKQIRVCAHGACQSISLAILAALPENRPRAVKEMPSFAVVSQVPIA